ncbi:MAG TPA: DinB family protein [Terriglobia bacterium]|nr:DinB family protein [Terriglobia bacterium]
MAVKDDALRKHLLYLLEGGGAHVSFETAIARLPRKFRGAKPPGAPHSPWQLLEHMRIAQWDILEFSRNPKHVSPEWPEGYWPATESPPGDRAWNKSLLAFRTDLQAMKKLVADPSVNLFSRILHGDGQTILREALLIADHNAYHLGQLILVRRLLGAWENP